MEWPTQTAGLSGEAHREILHFDARIAAGALFSPVQELRLYGHSGGGLVRVHEKGKVRRDPASCIE